MYHYTKSQKLDFIIPSIFLIVLVFVFHQTFLDEWLASHFYVQGSSWIYRNNYILEKILHKDGVIFSTTILVAVCGYWIYLWKSKTDEKRRDYCGFITAATVLTIVCVFFLKRWSTLPCPWDVVAFGGDRAPSALWQMFSSNLPNGKCFPAGHSSGGYGFLSVYFGYTFIYGNRNLKTLIPGLVIGITFGITQQMRGAHFLSHDLTTILISIFSSWVTSLAYSYYNQNYEN
ncbi:MAG: phosphatase PAP2 family protein [Rhizobacter sp.]|nr:phosphatase PAP2 family protein [Bacteriovorax sp.]